MRKVLLAFIVVLMFSVSIFAADSIPFTAYGRDWISNGNVSKSASVSVEVYQWIFASVEGTSIIITQPGDFKHDLVKILVASNAGITLDTVLSELPTGLLLDKISLSSGNVVKGESVSLSMLGVPLSKAEVLPTMIENNTALLVNTLKLSADFEVLPTLGAVKGTDAHIVNIDFTFKPTIRF